MALIRVDEHTLAMLNATGVGYDYIDLDNTSEAAAILREARERDGIMPWTARNLDR
jgi:hypothetical protein